MVRLDTAFHAFVANDELALKLEQLQNDNQAILVTIDGIQVALVREDEPQTQINNAENLLHI